jgi:hypothetical protein
MLELMLSFFIRDKMCYDVFYFSWVEYVMFLL